MLIGVAMLIPEILSHEQSISEFEIRVDNLRQDIVERTTHVYLTGPENLFQFLEDHPEWEEIDAVPYSKCYRHLIGDIASTSDYIMCKAI